MRESSLRRPQFFGAVPAFWRKTEDTTAAVLGTAGSNANFKNFNCVLFGKPYKVLHFDMWSFAPLGSHGSFAQ